ncbi:hypothetical protein [Alteromonas gilva]|uniref:DUF4168 domain-containing protein n=1 Tax=Alteromonas gilva TaxID=2987522 RepID=A0ABT5KY47_9ALTE|nr:hypothetical protein [Alteromonas gilva]MDC8829562.1 hypothetical protein [Alteromonas gilva]
MRKLLLACAAVMVSLSPLSYAQEGSSSTETETSAVTADSIVAGLTPEQREAYEAMDAADAAVFLTAIANGSTVVDAFQATLAVSTNPATLTAFAKALDPASATAIDNAAQTATAAGGAQGNQGNAQGNNDNASGNSTPGAGNNNGNGNQNPGTPVGAGNGAGGGGGGGNTGSNN